LCNDVQMGYGSRALALLKKYYEFKIPSIDEEQQPQEHIESVADENMGLLEETIGMFFNLSPGSCRILLVAKALLPLI